MAAGGLAAVGALNSATASSAATALSAAMASSAATPGARQKKKVFDPIEATLDRAVEEGNVPGIVALAATPAGIVYRGSFGKREIGQGPEMTPDTIFWIASMTKAVTATAAMQLVEDGRLKLEQPMGDLLPELRSIQVLEGFDAAGNPRLRPAKREITLRHLLTHTSGFVYSIWNEDMLRYLKVTATPSVADMKIAGFRAPLVFDPGERWEYGTGMDWIGRAIEAVCDQSLESYFRERIFAPLGMADSGFLIGAEQHERTARTYLRRADGSLSPAPFEMPQRPEFFSGGGGLFSTPHDYMKFLQMHLLDGRFNAAQILKPETARAIRRNHIGELDVATLKTAVPEVSNDVNLFPGMVQKWGLSFDINTEAGPAGRSAGSVSWAGVLNTYYWIDPKKRIAGIFMTQMLPFADNTVLKAYAAFERGVYQAFG